MRKLVLILVAVVCIGLTGCTYQRRATQPSVESYLRTHRQTWHLEYAEGENISNFKVVNFQQAISASTDDRDFNYAIKLNFGLKDRKVVSGGRIDIPVIPISATDSVTFGDCRVFDRNMYESAVLFIVNEKTKNRDSYIGQNAFGATSSVSSYEINAEAIYATNTDISICSGYNSSGLSGIDIDSYAVFTPAISVCGGFVGEAVKVFRPTIGIPVSSIEKYKLLSAHVHRILLVEKKTGQVKASLVYK